MAILGGGHLRQLTIELVKRKFDELIDASSNQNPTLSIFKGKSEPITSYLEELRGGAPNSNIYLLVREEPLTQTSFWSTREVLSVSCIPTSIRPFSLTNPTWHLIWGLISKTSMTTPPNRRGTSSYLLPSEKMKWRGKSRFASLL